MPITVYVFYTILYRFVLSIIDALCQLSKFSDSFVVLVISIVAVYFVLYSTQRVTGTSLSGVIIISYSEYFVSVVTLQLVLHVVMLYGGHPACKMSRVYSLGVSLGEPKCGDLV